MNASFHGIAAASSTSALRSADEYPEVANANLNQPMFFTGLFLECSLKIAILDIISGSGINIALLNLPDLLRAGSTSQGAFVAAITRTFWLFASIPSIS